MSLEGIIGVIEHGCAARLAEIEAQRAAELDAILAETRAQSDRIRQAALDEIAAPSGPDRLAALHDARFDALQTVEIARAELMEMVLDRVHAHLSEARRTSGYPDLLRHLVVQALAELASSLEPGEVAQLDADPRDRQIIESLIGSLDPQPAVTFELDCLGGIRAMVSDGRVVVDNTLETRLERVRPGLRAILVQALGTG